MPNLFDGSASLVKSDLLVLIRDELRAESEGDPSEADGSASDAGKPQPEQDAGQKDDAEQGEFAIPAPARRLKQVRLNVRDLAVGKTNNLQPYLFRVLQQQDAVAELQLSILVRSDPGIPEDILDRQIVEAFEQLGVSVEWEA